MKNKYIFIFFFISFFGVFNFVHADNLIGTCNVPPDSELYSPYGLSPAIMQTLTATTSPNQSFYLSKIEFVSDAFASTSDSVVSWINVVRDYTSGSPPFNVYASSSEVYLLTSSSTIKSYSFDNILLEDGHTYLFQLQSSSYFYSKNSYNTTSTPVTCDSPMTYGASVLSTVPYFSLYGIPESGATVELLYPEQYINTPDFDNWVIKANFYGGGSHSGTVYVDWYQQSDSVLHRDSYNFNTNSSERIFDIKKNISFSSTSTDVIRATVTLVINGQTIYHNGYDSFGPYWINFDVDSIPDFSDLGYSQESGAQWSEQGIASSSLVEGTSYANLCQDGSVWNPRTWKNCMISFAIETTTFFIYPHDIVKNALSNQFYNLKEVFPFNLFFDFSDVFQDNFASSSLQDFTLSVPYQDSVFVIYSSSTLQTFMGNENYDRMIDIEEAVIWILLGLFITMTVML